MGERADGRDRTGDLRFTRAALYQLSYVGVVSHPTPAALLDCKNGAPADVARL
jgi:hypothetical protein